MQADACTALRSEDLLFLAIILCIVMLSILLARAVLPLPILWQLFSGSVDE